MTLNSNDFSLLREDIITIIILLCIESAGRTHIFKRESQILQTNFHIENNKRF